MNWNVEWPIQNRWGARCQGFESFLHTLIHVTSRSCDLIALGIMTGELHNSNFLNPFAVCLTFPTFPFRPSLLADYASSKENTSGSRCQRRSRRTCHEEDFPWKISGEGKRRVCWRGEGGKGYCRCFTTSIELLDWRILGCKEGDNRIETTRPRKPQGKGPL